MPLIEHLDELRKTLISVLIILTVSFFISYFLGDSISEILLKPLREGLSNLNGGVKGQIVYLGILDKVLSQLQVAFWSSIIISSPLWFYQIWKFIKPGLYEKEAKIVMPFLLVGFFLFWCGILFGLYVVFPFTFKTLMDFGVSNVSATIGLKDYLVLASKILVLLGLLFQLPNLMLILGFMELVTKQSLRSWRRYVYVIFAILAAIVTPPDVLTMIAVLIPLVILYEFGILAVSAIVHPYLKKKYA